jgi:hypothetical protein
MEPEYSLPRLFQPATWSMQSQFNILKSYFSNIHLILQILGSDLGSSTDYSGSDYSLFSSVNRVIGWDNASIRSLQIPSKSSFIHPPTIRRYVV